MSEGSHPEPEPRGHTLGLGHESGTQLIAADKLGRRCYAMELSPQYVDVAVYRFEAFSGEKARKLE